MQDKCYITRCDCGRGNGYDRGDDCCEKKHHNCCEDDCCECQHESECNECGTNFKEAVCIHTDKIFDSCRDKDCASYILLYN